MDQKSRTDVDVCVVGLGYIGLPTAVFMAQSGLQVCGVDTDSRKLAKLKSGKETFQEPHFGFKLREALNSDSLTFNNEPVQARAFIIAVPTPVDLEKTPDNSYVEAAARSIARVLQGGEIVVLESTCAPGTTRQVSQWIHDEIGSVRKGREGIVFDIVYCPERVLPGRMVHEFESNSRVIGSQNDFAAKRAAKLYSGFVKGDIYLTSIETAELVKLAENSFRDINIAFANELADVCADFGVNVWELIELANKHPRVNILNPGSGVGGHCIAVDPWLLSFASPAKTKLISAARNTNDARPQRIVAEIIGAAGQKNFEGILLLGLTYKPDVDDLRESPAMEIALTLASKLSSSSIKIVEPHITDLPERLRDAGDVALLKLEDVELLELENYLVVSLVKHQQFQQNKRVFDHASVKIDPCGLFSPSCITKIEA